MSFYQKYRPKFFGEVIGQEQIIALLRKQARYGRFAHSYCFFGPSGTGKTSTARILAASMNCQNGLPREGEPCGECQPCEAIRKGSFWDVLEIDCAHFRGIDDIAELKRKAYLYPLGNKKVYILDEVHTLSDLAWNGLLKLLEEPPSYLSIILCSTQPSKIPETVKSRCQLYPFVGLSSDGIRAKLETICKGERVTADPKHIEFIAETACGNMRAAENILEQALVLVKGRR